MALTERLALLIDAHTGGAIRDLRKVERGVADLGPPLSRTDKAMAALGAQAGVSGAALKAGLATAAVAGAFGLGKLAQASVGAASALNEQASAAEQQFGSAFGAVEDFAEGAADSIGLSERAALQATNTFGTFFTNIGLGAEDAAKFSTGLTSLTSDLASLKDLSTEDVRVKLSSGLAGETEALRTLGVFISEAAVKAKAAELGFKPLNGLFSDQAKVMARLSLIFEQTGTAQGNYALTSGELANQQRTLGAEIENVSAALGEVLTPAVSRAIDDLTSLARAGQDAGDFLGQIDDSLGGLPGKILGGLGTANVFELSRAANETDDAATAAAGMRAEYRSLRDVMPGLAAGLNEVHQSLSSVNAEMADTRGAFLGAVDAEGAYEQALDSIDDAGRAAADAHRGLADAQDDQRRAIGDLTREVEANERAVTRAARSSMAAQRDLREANEDLSAAQDVAARTLADFSPNSRRAHEALEDLEDAEARQQDAAFNAEDAAYSYQEAQRALIDTTVALRDELNGVGPAADRVRDAQDQVRESSDGLRDAQDNLGRAAIALEIALAEERDTLAANNEEFEAFVGWLEALKTKYPEAAAAIDGLIGRAQTLRGEIALLNEEIGVNMTNALGNVANVLGRFLVTPPGFGNPYTPPDPRLSPNNPFPPVPLVPQQGGGKSGPLIGHVSFHEKIDPMHAARELKRQLMPGG